MSIPLATTTISVARVAADPTRDGYDAPPAASTVASGVRAHIGRPAGNVNLAGGVRESVGFTLDCDPIVLTTGDTITDDRTGEQYTVLWARTRIGLGLDHTQAALQQVTGVL